MGIFENKKFQDAIREVEACARTSFKLNEEVLKDARREMDKRKSTGIALPKKMILPLFGRDANDETAVSSITYCLNEKIRNNPELRKLGVKLGYMGDDITFKDVDWDNWEKDRKEK